MCNSATYHHAVYSQVLYSHISTHSLHVYDIYSQSEPVYTELCRTDEDEKGNIL